MKPDNSANPGARVPLTGGVAPVGYEPPAEKSGATLGGKSVEVVPSAEVKNVLRAEGRSYAGVSLVRRSIAEHLPRTGLLNRIITYFRDRPTASERTALRAMYNNLEKALGAQAGSVTESALESRENTFTVNKGSDGHRICALMVKAGLARFEERSEEGDRVTIRFVRTSGFEQKVRGIDLLVQTCPVVLGKDGELDWGEMLEQESNALQPGFKTDEYIGSGEGITPSWFVETKGIAAMERILSRRQELSERLDQLAQEPRKDDNWLTVSVRAKRLKSLAKEFGIKGVDNVLSKSFIQNIENQTQEEWRASVREIGYQHPSFVPLWEAMEPYYQALSANYQERTDKFLVDNERLMTLKKNMNEFAEDHELTGRKLFPEDIERIDIDKETLEVVGPVFMCVVEAKIRSEAELAFGRLKLPKQSRITQGRLQQGLGVLKREMTAGTYEKCVDDNKRKAFITSLEAKVDQDLDERIELLRTAKEEKIELRGEIQTLLSTYESEYPKQGEDGVRVVDVELSARNALRIVKMYDELLNELNESGQPFTLDELVKRRVQNALDNGISLSKTDWGKGVEAYILSTS